MKAAIFEHAGKMVVEDVAKPQIQAPDDVLIKVIRTCVCGSDLWSYKEGDQKQAHSMNDGHEALGIIEEVGEGITDLKVGDFVIAPFTHGCGQCAGCKDGFDGTCDNHPAPTNWGGGYQAQYLRFHYANWALIKVPGKSEDYSEEMMKSLLTLADVMATGYHAAFCARVKKGDKVVVIGDGAVGQSAVIAAKMMGASRIVLMSRHEDRQKLALESGATDIVEERGEEGIAKVREILGGPADAALECVGKQVSFEQAVGVLRSGGRLGYVGVPHEDNLNLWELFSHNIQVAGGSASVTTHVKNVLLDAVLKGEINPGRVFTQTYSLDEIDQAYKDMADRKTIKSYVIVD